MVIFMEEAADARMVAKIAAKLVCDGFRIRVENKNGNGRFAVAVLGSAADDLDIALLKKMPGVAKCTQSNEYYNDNFHHFKDPYSFFPWGF